VGPRICIQLCVVSLQRYLGTKAFFKTNLASWPKRILCIGQLILIKDAHCFLPFLLFHLKQLPTSASVGATVWQESTRNATISPHNQFSINLEDKEECVHDGTNAFV
jgi:hypothetical protein